MLDNLTQRLARVMKTLKGEARLTETNIADALREVRMALLEADVALPVVKEFIAAVKEKAVGEEVIGSLSPGQALIGVVHAELTKIMGAAHEGINFNTQPPAIVLMAGLQGAGKTTTVGKLGKFLKENHKKKVLVVSCDVYRPAAIAEPKARKSRIRLGTPDSNSARCNAASLVSLKSDHIGHSSVTAIVAPGIARSSTNAIRSPAASGRSASSDPASFTGTSTV